MEIVKTPYIYLVVQDKKKVRKIPKKYMMKWAHEIQDMHTHTRSSKRLGILGGRIP